MLKQNTANLLDFHEHIVVKFISNGEKGFMKMPWNMFMFFPALMG